jgi:hypothetical protein
VHAERVVRQGMNHPMLVGDRQLGSQDMQDMLAGEEFHPDNSANWWVATAILAAIALLVIASRILLGDHTSPSSRMDAIRPSAAQETHTTVVQP